jgi:hypothetical protein
MRTLNVVGAAIVSLWMVSSGAAQPTGGPTNYNELYVVEYADPAYARQGPFYFRNWPGSSPFTNWDGYFDVPGKCAPPTIVIDGDVGSGPFVQAYGRGAGSPTDIHPTAQDSWLFFWGDSLNYGGWSYTAFGRKYDCVGNVNQIPEGYIYVFRFPPAQQRYFSTIGWWYVGDTLFCHLQYPWFQANGTPNPVVPTTCNWYYTWSRTQFYPPGTSAASLSSEQYEGLRHEDPRLQDLARQLRDQIGSLMIE